MRELSYELSFERLKELCTRGIRVIRGGPRNRLRLFAIWALVGLPLGVGIGWLQDQMAAAGFDRLSLVLLVILLLIAIYAVCFILTYRDLLRRLWEGADTVRHYRVTQDSGGLRFATGEDEYYLKWHGITRM